MCQLSFIDTEKAELNRLYTLTQSIFNSKVSHKDGFGFYSENSEIWKTAIAASNLSNMGMFLKVLDKKPVMFHCRQASSINKTLLGENYAHPFETEKLILAHNGTLEVKEGSPSLTKIDSQIFLERLTENYFGIELPEAISKTVDEFYGKFAFLIFDKINKEYYFVRGESANLNYYQFTNKKTEKPVGIAVNTENESFVDGLMYLHNYAMLTDNSFNEFKVENIKQFEPNTIWKYLNNGVMEKVGEVKETKKEIPVITTLFRSEKYYDDYGCGAYWSRNREKKESINFLDISEYMNEWSVDLEYMDELAFSMLGKGLLEITEEDSELFLVGLNILQKHFIQEPRKCKSTWKGIVAKISATDAHFGNLQFPWFMDKNINTFRKIYSEIGDKK